MGTELTLDTFSKAGWKIVKRICQEQSSAKCVYDYLGEDEGGLLGVMFGVDWLKKIKICCQDPLPSVKADELASELGYDNAKEMASECKDKRLLGLVSKFEEFLSNKGSSARGASWGDFVFIGSTDAKSRATIAHELVHSLQWAHWGGPEWLRRYLCGFNTKVGFGVAYQANPAEKKAREFGNEYVESLRSILLNLAKFDQKKSLSILEGDVICSFVRKSENSDLKNIAGRSKNDTDLIGKLVKATARLGVPNIGAAKSFPLVQNMETVSKAMIHTDIQ